MEPNHAQGARSRHANDWRGARGLVIEGEARVISRRGSRETPSRPAEAAPRWGAALDRAAALAPVPPRVARLALPAGLALVALAAFALSPAEAERHGAAASIARAADAAVIR